MTDETPTPELPDPDDESLRGGTTEIDNDEPLGVPADKDSEQVGDQPGIPSEGEPPASE
jgi:hypothetical protein